MLSFYTLPSTVIGNPTYKTLKAAFMYYTVAKETPLHQLMTDALILASKGCELSLSYSGIRSCHAHSEDDQRGEWWSPRHSLRQEAYADPSVSVFTPHKTQHCIPRFLPHVI